MNFDLNNIAATLIHFSPRRELHGQDPEPAGDLKVRADLTNNDLALFHPTLKSMLYHFDKSLDAQESLIDDPQHAPHIRFPQLPVLKWDGEVTGAKVTIHHGISAKSDIVLETCNVDNFTIEPKQGGTVTLTFRIQSHPDMNQSGHLCTMIGTDIEISIESPTSDASE